MKTLQGMVATATLGLILAGSQPAVAAISVSDFSTGGGSVYTGGGTGSQVIPDNSPVGVGYAVNFAPSGLLVGSISVSLTLSGGYNGDIYAYLSHGSQIAVLFDQITGTAAGGSGFNVTLVGGTGNPIQTASGTAGAVLTGTTFTANDNLTLFNNTDPNGAWTIFFADRSAGDTSTLTGFTLSLTAVPEPVNVALAFFGVGLVVTGLIRRHIKTHNAVSL
jgi:subtilisin-like proprotein convertase family protein